MPAKTGQIAALLIGKAKPAAAGSPSPDEAAMRAFMDALKADDAAAALAAFRDLGKGGAGDEAGESDGG